MTYKEAILKRNVELAIMFPFVLLGKLTGKLFKLKTKHRIFLFFRNAEIGGSTKVNIDIINCIKDLKPLVIFTKHPSNNQFRDLFNVEGVRILDLHKYIDNKFLHFLNFFFRGVFASWINAEENPVVFGGECIFFYKIVPHVKKQTKTIELCHVTTWFEYTRAFIKYIDLRIFSTPKLKRDIENQYISLNLPEKYYDRLRFVDNKIDIPADAPYVVDNQILEVLFVGRGAPQKRVHLIAEIAKKMHEANRPVHFSFVGDVETIIPPETQQYCTLYGKITDAQLMNSIYAKSDVLLLTSQFEGLPIVVMDMMARGKVVVSTAVDGIPDYVTHMQNGLLIRATEEQKVVEEGISLLNFLIENPDSKQKMGLAAYNFAVDHFGGSVFCSSYRGFLA